LRLTVVPGSASWGQDLDQAAEAPEVRMVESKQPSLAVRQHGSNDVGVMHMASAKGKTAAERAFLLLQIARRW
jgi:hypothetical protein